jgi:signal transduction histidine kinase
VLINTGGIRRADDMQTRLNENVSAIKQADKVTKEILPEGCGYGVYDKDGTYLYGTYGEIEAKEAWTDYMEDNIYARGKGYYRFIAKEDGELCIVNYFIEARYTNAAWNRYLPSPVIMTVILFVLLFLFQTVILARSFGKHLSRRLEAMNEMTQKIQRRDLEFDEEHSDIKEIDEVMDSLYKMKCALKESLEEQWNQEKEKQEQIAALAHDIKTPLTIIKGNAQLLEEGSLAEEEQEYNQYILRNIAEIEHYLAMLREMLLSPKESAGEEKISCQELGERLEEQARILAAASRQEVLSIKGELAGEARCDYSQIERAWNNLIGNALEYNPEGKELRIDLQIFLEEGQAYLAAKVTDWGRGFDARDLAHATEQFYQGDESRHDRSHHGIGLYTAARFAAAQGGRIRLSNSKETGGGEVTLYLRLE